MPVLLQRRVVEVEATAVLEACDDRLKDFAIEANRVAACTEGQPVQIDAARPPILPAETLCFQQRYAVTASLRSGSPTDAR